MNISPLKPANFPWFDYSRYTFSLGLTDRQTAWLSGHSASEYDEAEGHIVLKGGIEEQTRTAYAKILAILEAASLGSANVHRVVEYVTAKGIDEYEGVERVRLETFGETRPAVCTVVVNRLLRPEALIEIEVIAGRSGSSGQDGVFDSGRLVYLPSLISSAENDLVAQTSSVFEMASELLKSAGVDMSHVVKTVDYTTPSTLKEYRDTGKVRKDFLGPVYPAAAGILLSRLQHPDALISLDVIASREIPEVVNPGWDRYSRLTYSPAVKAGSLLFMSGQASLHPETEKAKFPGDIAAQAEYTYSNVIEVLKAAGGGAENLVKTIEYVTPSGLDRYREVAKVRDRLLVEPYPASTGVVCETLLRPEFQFEVDPFAVL
jgi:enamine deaminase RidA (YjgF/YER057c/UK114 family)